MVFRRVAERGLKCLYTFLWLAVVLVVYLFRGIRASSHRLLARHFSTLTTLPQFLAETRFLRQNAKLPDHLAVCVVPESSGCYKFSSVFRTLVVYCLNFIRTTNRTDELFKESFESLSGDCDDGVLEVQSIARLIGWAWIANISVISLYDYNGKLKLMSERLRKAVIAELETVLRVENDELCRVPGVKIHFESNDKLVNGYTNGVNGYAKDQLLHIYLYSNEDGKNGLVKAAKGLVTERKSHSKGFTDAANIDENDVKFKYNEVLGLKKETLSVGMKTEPDLLVILGNVTSTLGFLPWQIRLTEIHWLPSPKQLEIADFLKSLRKYSGCEQRFGT